MHLKDRNRIIFIESWKKKKTLPTIREVQSKLAVALSPEACDEFRSFRDGSLVPPYVRRCRRPLLAASDFGSQFGLLPREKIELMVRRKMISSQELEDAQFQPASLDLRLGAKAYRVRASFLPGKTTPCRIALML